MKELLETVLTRVETLEKAGQLDLPKDYSAANALQGAWLLLQDLTIKDKSGNYVKALEYCTKQSISFALLRMVLDGLSPLKSQGAFVPRGQTMTWVREYAGNMAIAKRTAGVERVNALVVWEGDVFHYVITEAGKIHVVEHKSTIDNIGGKIKGAYAVVHFMDNTKKTEIMTWDQIQKAWKMAGTITKAHTDFPDQMAIKTVINRALKPLINSTSDESMFDSITTQVAENLIAETVPSHDLPEISHSENWVEAPEETPIFEAIETDAPEW
jgi:recombination protein RecT